MASYPAGVPPTLRVRLADCRFPLHDLSIPHMFPAPDLPLEDGPISVSRLDNGEWFVQSGRHRVIRARLRGDQDIDATDHDRDTR
jgi:hypothetical protein